MIRRNVYTQQMLERVADFLSTHLDLFTRKSAAADLLQSIAATATSLRELARDQVSGEGDVRASSVSRKEARRVLRTHLQQLNRTARALDLPMFFMPDSRSDAALIASGEAWARDAQLLEESLREEFVRHGLASDFAGELNAAVAVLKRTQSDHDMSKESRAGAKAEFEARLKEAQRDLKRLDALVLNTLRDKVGAMAEWKIARRVGRPPARARKPANQNLAVETRDRILNCSENPAVEPSRTPDKSAVPSEDGLEAIGHEAGIRDETAPENRATSAHDLPWRPGPGDANLLSADMACRDAPDEFAATFEWLKEFSTACSRSL